MYKNTFQAAKKHPKSPINNTEVTPALPSATVISSESNKENTESRLVNVTSSEKKEYKKPAQDVTKQNLSDIEKKLNALCATRDSGLGTPETETLIRKLRLQFTTETNVLKRKQQDVIRQKKARDVKRSKLMEVCSKNPDVANLLKVRQSSGRPRIETDQPELLKVIIKIAMFGSGADDRRRSELIGCCKTLDDLHLQLQNYGYNISRSSTYLRLIPRRSNTTEGKRHVITVPVKLIRAQTSEHKHHSDSEFCTASIRGLESLASLLGPKEVFFLSQDDKARIPLGISAANKQSAILMHMEYKVTLPDHDWVKASKHKLIPSVYAGITIKENGMGNPDAVTYSGPTFIAIRSGKHSSSTAETHAKDIDDIFQMDLFESICKTEADLIKPIFMISVDGGPDENPRYAKVIKFGIRHFKSYNLDALYVVTNAPGRSAFNRVERRMAPLSHELAGVILPHDHFGSHLDNQGRTIDEDLERENFKHAGEVLGKIWSGLSIDSYDVEALYVEPGESRAFLNDETDPEWYAMHVRESQYLLQIVKCNSLFCCGPLRSSLRSVLPNGFLPPPMKIKQHNTHGIRSTDASDPGGKFMSLFVQLAVNIKHHAPGFRQVRFTVNQESFHERYTYNVEGYYFSGAI